MTQGDEQAAEDARQFTAATIRQVLQDQTMASLLSVKEREELIEQVSSILPAGNVLNFVLSGITNANSRTHFASGRSHVNALFNGLNVMRNNVVYRMMFAGPATILAGYNMLLNLVGANQEEFLPDGVWQFYVEFGLREDAAHHQNETIGFHRAIRRNPNTPTEAHQLTAWCLAALGLLRDYDDLLEQIWVESVWLKTFEDTTGRTGLNRRWQVQRPFAAPDDQTRIVDHRSAQFDAFCEKEIAQTSPEAMRAFHEVWNNPANMEERGRRIRAYVRQMTIFRYLEPGDYSEERHKIQQDDLVLGVIYEDRYHFIVVSDPADPATVGRVYTQATKILQDSGPPAEIDLLLVNAPRSNQIRLRGQIPKEQRPQLDYLRHAPVIINWDAALQNQPLTFIRTGKRGIGDHAMTMFRTDQSMVFDFSHIFFDGPRAMAIAEMLNNEAIRFMDNHQHQMRLGAAADPIVPDLSFSPRMKALAAQQPMPINYISAEFGTPIEPLQRLRREMTNRTRLATRLTINDLLVLYRTVFNQYYEPSAELREALDTLRLKKRNLARDVDDMLAKLKTTNPSLLIPMDASMVDPKERLFPTTFRSPLPNFRDEHDSLLRLFESATSGGFFSSLLGGRQQTTFNEKRADYLGYLDAFSKVMARYREIAKEGNSMSSAAVRLIAGLPEAMQQVVDEIPGRFSVVNEAIKGEEVFSNVGRVTPGSSISRFASAKDDNDKKVLVWAFMTNEDNQLLLTLRDFRPPVIGVTKAGYTDIAQMITADFASAYTRGLVTFARQMEALIVAK